MFDQHVIDFIPAYALGILEADEARQVAAHLESCPGCTAELQSYRRVAEQLPLAAPDAVPPAHLKASILRQLPPKQGVRASATPAPARREKRSWRQALLQSIPALSPAWSLVSLVLILVLGASNLLLWQRFSQIDQPVDSHFITVNLQGAGNSSGAVGLLVMDEHGNAGTLVVDGLPLLDASKTYQLWLIRDGQRSNGGTFSVDAQGYGSLWVASQIPLTSFDSFGVTVEPAGGSPGPTGDKVLGGEL